MVLLSESKMASTNKNDKQIPPSKAAIKKFLDSDFSTSWTGFPPIL